MRNLLALLILAAVCTGCCYGTIVLGREALELLTELAQGLTR